MTGQERWLVVRLSALGDAALTTGVLAHWGQERGMRFSVVTREALVPLFANHPFVDEIFSARPKDLTFFGWLRFCRALRRQCPGMGLLDLHGSLRSRILSALWPGEVRRYPRYRRERKRFLATGDERARDVLLAADVPQRYWLALNDGQASLPASEELGPRLYLRPEEMDAAEAFIAERVDPARPLAVLHPFATHPNKAWPKGHWQDLWGLLEEAGWEWLVVGRGSGAAFVAADDPRNAVNQTGLRLTMAVLARARVLVTGDSGPMHLARGVDTPVAALFGPTHRAWGFYPSGKRDVVLETDLDCRPCSLHGREACPRNRECLASITPERVLKAVLDMA